MSLWHDIYSAGARLFGPPIRPDLDGIPGQIQNGRVAAALVGLGAKMAKADGQVRTEDSYAKIIARKFRARPAVLEDVMDGLFHISLADGVITAEEMAFLKTVSDIFGFSEREFKRIQIAHCGRASDDPYLILGVDEDISDSDLKRAYRRMAAANHPDRLVARGLPRELSRLATHKMAMINKAYDEIRAERARYAAQNRSALPES